MGETNTCLLVHSGDRGEWVWPYWKKLWQENWSCNNFVDTVFLGETKSIECDGVQSLVTGEVPWGAGLMATLKTLPYRWIIYHHEDYFLDEPQEHDKLKAIIKLCEDNSIKLLKICGYWGGDSHWDKADLVESGHVVVHGEHSEPVYIYDNTHPYTVSHQSSIWDRDFLITTIQERYTPWCHEIEGSLFVQNSSTPIHVYRGKPPIPYSETVQSAKIREGAEHFFTAEDVGDHT